MNTRRLMRASALFLGVLGISGTFLPQEVLGHAGAQPIASTVVLVQIAGALYLGFAMLNWMAQGNVIGGIYSRPVAIGNVAHFTVGAFALGRFVVADEFPVPLTVVAAGYIVFAVLFARVAFRHLPASRVGA